jgi:hypothetical protein
MWCSSKGDGRVLKRRGKQIKRPSALKFAIIEIQMLDATDCERILNVIIVAEPPSSRELKAAGNLSAVTVIDDRLNEAREACGLQVQQPPPDVVVEFVG